MTRKPQGSRPDGGPVRRYRKRQVGIVTSDRCAKTITVACVRTLKHPLYGKYLRRTKKFLAHDEENSALVGDRVEIMEARPLSKRKRWRLVRIVERAHGGPPVERVAARKEREQEQAADDLKTGGEELAARKESEQAPGGLEAGAERET